MSNNLCIVESPIGYKVCVSRNTWENHIITGHKTMENNLEAVIDTIKNPDAIFSSEEWPDKRHVYFSTSKSATYKNLYTKVVVNTPDEYNEYGEVVSAWPQKDMSGGIEGIKYVKPKLR